MRNTMRDAIAAHHPSIIGQWSGRMQMASFAEGLSLSELTGIMPMFLSLLGHCNSDVSDVGSSVQLSDVQRALVERHMSNRLRQGSTLNDVLTEFATLSQCISVSLDDGEATNRPSTRDAARVFAELNLTCIAATQIFNEYLLEDEQIERRFGRLLQKIATEGLVCPRIEGVLRTPLREAVELIMEAMEAHLAVLLRFDAENDPFIVSVATGDEGEKLERYVRSPNALRFVSRVASMGGEAVTATAVEMVGLVGSDWRELGKIHSLLGVQLSSRNGLGGVFYVGLHEDRKFSPSETRRIENLGEKLAMHLEYSELDAALAGKCGEILVEHQRREHFIAALMHDHDSPLMSAKARARTLLEAGSVASAPIATSIIRDLVRIEELVENFFGHTGQVPSLP